MFSYSDTDLRNLAATCGYGELKDSLICDRMVCGIISDRVKGQNAEIYSRYSIWVLEMLQQSLNAPVSPKTIRLENIA